MSVKIQFKRTTASAWTSLNPTLFAGELGYETDTGKYKIGDGSTAWTSLAYAVTANLAFATLNDLGDVTITSAQNGDFLRWNGTAFVNDAVDLGTDTIGSFVQSLVAGTGITLTNNSGENATPTIAVTANTFDAFGAASTAAGNAATALTNHEADTTSIHGIADTSLLVTTTGSQTLTNKTITTPSGLVKNDVGLGNVDNTADTAKPVSTAQQTALDLKANLASPTFTGTVTIPTGASITAPTGLVKGDVGLGSVDNTADSAKPVSTAGQTALDLKANLASPTFTGTPTLPTGTIAVTQTAADNSTKLATTAYVESAVASIVDSAPATLNTLNELADALGDDPSFATTVSNSIGLKAPLASPTFTGTVSGISASMVGLGNVDNTSDANKPVSTAGQTALDLKANLASPTFTGTVTLPSGTVTSGMILDGTIANVDISSSAAIADSKLATISTASKVSNSATTATDANTASSIVARDASGNFTAGTVTAALSGNATTATTLANARNIAGQSFNGSANISIAPTDLTGVTSTAAEINILDGATLSTTELNYVDGVTSAIQTQIDTKAPIASPTFTGTVTIPTGASITAPTGLVKGDVGLGSVDNTADTAKPVSTAQQTALDLKANLASPTFTGTVTVPTPTNNTDASTKAYVDATASTTAGTASTALSNHEADTTNIHGIADTSILVTTTGTQTLTNKTITSPTITLPTGLVKSDVGLGNVDNTSDANKPVSTAQQTALDLKANLNSPTFTGTVVLPDNTVALGTKTTGDFVATITGGTGVTSTAATTGEGTTHSLSIGQAVGTTDNVTFAGVTADAIKIGVTDANEIDTTSGNLTIDSAGGTVTVDDNLIVTGNLTVSGTTTSINTETLTIDDNVIVLNNNATGAPSVDAGIEIERGSSTNVVLRWNETDDKWQLTNDGTNYGNIVNTYDTGTVSTAMIASDAVTTSKIADGAVTNDKVSVSAAIVDTKLATISTAGKVLNSATTATNLDIANAIVARDANGAFSAGSITASLNGNASSATILQTSRNIAGQAFNGSANISIAPTDLTGVTSTASEINVLDGITSSTAELNILDGVTADASELNILDGATLSTTELNYVDGVTSAIQAQIDLKAPLANPTFTGTVAGISATMVGLGNVNNTSDVNKPVSTATQTALDLKAPLANPTFTGTVTGVTATHVGLGSVNNTSDADKPVSTATQTALDLKANLASPTFTGTPTLPTGTVAFTQTLGNNTTAIATTAFIQTALANFGGMTVSDNAPTVDVEAGDFWFDSLGLNLYIYYSGFWTQVTVDEPLLFDLSELTDVAIGQDLLPNHTLRWDGVNGYWVNSVPRQNVSDSASTSYSVGSSDSGKLLKFNSSSATTVNLGSWSANIGEKVDIAQFGTGQVTIAVSGGSSIVSPNNSVTTRARYSLVTVTCVASNIFLLSGDLT